MRIVADFHLHSKYSRAVSSKMIIPEIARWAKLKGIDLVGTADWTHPAWVRELKSQLIETAPGIFQQKTFEAEELSPLAVRETSRVNGEGKGKPRFLLVTELSSIYSQKGRTYKIHNLVLAPSFETVEKINAELTKRGVNLISDGRPIMRLSARDLAELIFSINENCLIIPAHVWTPWFSLYGSNSGFDLLEECFGDMAKYIYAVETGLSSDPEMNWRIGELDNRQIVSFSDAHSGVNLGREATVFEIPEGNVSYQAIRMAIMGKGEGEAAGLGEVRGSSENTSHFISSPSFSPHLNQLTIPRISYTIEFFPQEGKYHYTGHRNCGVSQSPKETKKLGRTCPVCGKPLTVGVMHRVEELASRTKEELKRDKREKRDKFGVKKIGYANRAPYVMLVPLAEVITEIKRVGKLSKSVMEEYLRVIRGVRGIGKIKGELGVLLETPVEEIAKVGGEKLAEGIKKVRSGDVYIEPGFDGVYGKVQVWPSFAEASEGKPKKEQMSLF